MSGNNDWNDVPSWYTSETEAAPQAHAPQLAAPAPQFPAGSSAGGRGGGLSPAAAKLGIKGLIFAGILGWGAFSTLGTTSAENLSVGDCFVLDDEVTEFNRLDTPDCSEPHDGQIFANLTMLSTSTYPSDSSPVWDANWENCLSAAEAVVTRVEALPEDTVIDFIAPTEAAWNEGDRTFNCAIVASSGLEGSHVAVAPS